jgi:hypothetical protein
MQGLQVDSQRNFIGRLFMVGSLYVICLQNEFCLLLYLLSNWATPQGGVLHLPEHNYYPSVSTLRLCPIMKLSKIINGTDPTNKKRIMKFCFRNFAPSCF